MEVIQLPSHATELNPVEPMWGHTKGAGLRGYVPADRLALEVEADGVLHEIGHHQQLLSDFFEATPLDVPGVTTHGGAFCRDQ